MKPATSKEITKIFSEARTHGHAFALYRMPDAKKVNHIVGTVSRHLKATESAFAFAPFEPSTRPYYIKALPVSSLKRSLPQSLGSMEEESTSKKQYAGLVRKIIAAIKAGDFKKIVAARVLAIDKPTSFDPLAFFEKLCEEYSRAFVSLTYIPAVGLWIGASPEVLVAESGAGLTIYSLAGTKAIGDESLWTAKEKEEQKIVTDFIFKKIRSSIGGKISLKGPVTIDAGRVKHLLSVFTIQHSEQQMWGQVVKALHPTPAVSGMPQHKALQFLKREESFRRTFYAGYLGPVNCAGKTDLFVNLRCVKVTGRQLLFYAGCGVTADSDPDEEWLESERKIEVLKSLI